MSNLPGRVLNFKFPVHGHFIKGTEKEKKKCAVFSVIII